MSSTKILHVDTIPPDKSFLLRIGVVPKQNLEEDLPKYFLMKFLSLKLLFVYGLLSDFVIILKGYLIFHKIIF